MGWGIVKSLPCSFLSRIYLSPAVTSRPGCGSAPPCTERAAASRCHGRSRFLSARWRWHHFHCSPLRRTQRPCDCFGQWKPSCCPALPPAGSRTLMLALQAGQGPPELCPATGDTGCASFTTLGLLLRIWTGTHTSGNDAQRARLPRAYFNCLHGVYLFSKVIHSHHTQLDYMQRDRSTAVVNPQTQSLQSERRAGET